MGRFFLLLGRGLDKASWKSGEGDLSRCVVSTACHGERRRSFFLLSGEDSEDEDAGGRCCCWVGFSFCVLLAGTAAGTAVVELVVVAPEGIGVRLM